MSLTARLTRLPRVIAGSRSDEAVAAMAASGDFARLLGGAAAASPYLHGLILRHAEWLSGAEAEPEAAFDALLESDEIPLRRMKARAALLLAVCDLGGVWDLGEVTGRLTRLADRAVDRALGDAVGREIARGRLPGQGEDDIATGGGLAVIAMGKMGAFELNFSSDIDLICLYDETRFDPAVYAEARSAFVRAVRAMTKRLSERTAEGYVFRTDLRLRPDASVTPVAISMEAAERYYEAFGRTWERAAWIKARPSAGDQAAGARFAETLRPFVWRRHLDFAAIRDADEMRHRIRDTKGLWDDSAIRGRDLKLGPGGIREIEFFVQTRQLISGGRDPDLRVPGTLEGLTRLAEKGWIESDMARALSAAYETLREAEHRLQMIADRQTHEIPTGDEEIDAVAALMGVTAEEFETRIARTLEEVSSRIEGFFAEEKGPAAPAATPELDDDAREIVGRWPAYPALRSPRAVEIFRSVRPRLMERLADCADPKAALVHLDAFLRGLPAGVQLFSLFQANPQLLDLIVDISDTAPALARHLGRNAGVLDAVIGGDFFAEWPGEAALARGLADMLHGAPDYEAKLDQARIWMREWHFRVGVHHLRGLADGDETARAFGDLAQAVVGALWPVVVAEFARKHGAPPGRGAAVLAMGSLGARRLTASSDLDLILVYDGAGVQASDGPRELATRAYYARLTQALVTALSAPTAEGRLYEVDLRLRPSGRQGPVATSWNSFRDYQRNEAWTWEHLALTRARVAAGAEELGAEIEALRREILETPRDRGKTLADVAEMRARLFAAKGGGGGLDAVDGPGRHRDLELFAQTGTLLAGEAARDPMEQLGIAARTLGLYAEDTATLTHAARLFGRVRLARKLTGEEDQVPKGVARFLVRETGTADMEDLTARMDDHARAAAAIIDARIGTTDDA